MVFPDDCLGACESLASIGKTKVPNQRNAQKTPNVTVTGVSLVDSVIM
jgi:hypothetical protein